MIYDDVASGLAVMGDDGGNQCEGLVMMQGFFCDSCGAIMSCDGYSAQRNITKQKATILKRKNHK